MESGSFKTVRRCLDSSIGIPILILPNTGIPILIYPYIGILILILPYFSNKLFTFVYCHYVRLT